MVSDLQLIKNVKEKKDGKSFEELLERHTGVYTSIINRYSFHSAINKNDLIDDKVFNIYQYIIDYDPSREMKFSSYVGQRIKYACQTIVTKHPSSIPIDSVLPEGLAEDKGDDSFSWSSKIPIEKNTLDEYEIEDVMEKIFDILKKLKDERVLKIFKLRHSPNLKKEMPWWKIGKELNISTQTAINIYYKNLEFLKNNIKNKL